MTSYLADTNIFIRLLIQNIGSQTREAEGYLRLAKDGKLKIVVISEVFPEIEYVLRKVYKIPRPEIADKLTTILKMMYLDIEKRQDWLEAVSYYLNLNMDIVDAFLAVVAKNNNMDVLSFDKDFKKLKKYAKID